MLRSRRIFCQRNIWPNLLHAPNTSFRTDHFAVTTGAASEAASLASKPSLSSVTPAIGASFPVPLALGNKRKAGTENNAHHAPEPPMANRSASVDPPCALDGKYSDQQEQDAGRIPERDTE